MVYLICSVLTNMLHLTYGCMFAGKSKQLVEDARLYTMARIKVISHSATGDDPWVHSRSGASIACDKVDDLMLVSHKGYDVFFIDEAQFFPNLVPFVYLCLKAGSAVCVYGLNGDYRGKLMGHMHELIPHADTITHLTARCACGLNAIYSKRIGQGTQLIDVDAEYRPVCRLCKGN